MIYTGQAAFDYLADEVNKEDSGESSYWRKYHSAFRFTGEGFDGLQGFGGNEKPYHGLRLAIHTLLQSKFRRMGKEFPDFRLIDSLAQDIVTKQNRAYDLDVLRQSLTISLLKKYFHEHLLNTKSTACVIGDGFASMTSLLLASGLASKVVLINLTKTLLVDLWYLRLWLGSERFNSSVDLVTDEDGLNQVLSKPEINEYGDRRIIAIQAAQHILLREIPVDMAINIASMQEMDPTIINKYFDDMRAISKNKNLMFYCCNREEKKLPDGSVIRFSDYPWRENDKIIVDELCPWHQQYYDTIRPPFYHSYDGSVRHRLVTFNG